MKRLISEIQLTTSLTGILCILYMIASIMALAFIADTGNSYNPQIGQDSITRSWLYLKEQPWIILLGILNIIYSISRKQIYKSFHS